jgi:hypothetical protein
MNAATDTPTLKVNGIMRDAEDPRALVLYLSRDPDEDELRAIHDAARAFGLVPHALPDLQARYDIQTRELQRERTAHAAALAEISKLRAALGPHHETAPAPARSMAGG